jgi:uncharacterized delta-60 repeat protein
MVIRRVVLVALAISVVHGVPGQRDPSFGRNGVTTVHVLADAGLAVAMQPDEKIVEVGYASRDKIYRYALLRTDVDGRLDPTFGSSGVVTHYVSNGVGYGVALQPDGRIVTAGSATVGGLPQQSLVRFLPDGEVDPSFGVGGIVLNGATLGASEVALQADGKILTVAAGVLSRYNPDGSKDPTFGSEGEAASVSDGIDLTVLGDGRMLVAGTEVSPDNAVLVARHLQDGELDQAFGEAGIARTPIGEYVFTTALAVQPDGRIVAVGGVGLSRPFLQHYLIVRYLESGLMDAGFGQGGVVVVPVPGDHYARDVAVQEDGRIVVVGTSGEFPYSDFTVVRLRSDGSLDESFGNHGIVIDRSGLTSQPGTGPAAVVLQQDGKIVVAGTVITHRPSFDFALVRYLPA